MSEHKSEESKEFKGTRNSKLKRNSLGRAVEAGFSLVELMISSAIGTIVALGISTLFVFAIDQFTMLVDQNNAEEDLLWATYHIKSFLSQGVAVRTADLVAEIDGEGANGLNEAAPSLNPINNRGVIAQNYDSRLAFPNDLAAPGPRVDLVALFPRENAYPTAAGMPGTQLFTTAIYFVRPHIGVPGRLFIDPGANTGAAPPALVPDQQAIFYDNLTELSFNTMPPINDLATGENRVRTVAVTMATRYFKSRDRSLQAWCPLGFMGAAPCNLGGQYRDIDVNFNVSFRNNILITTCADIATGCPASSAGPAPTPADLYTERLNGGLYFFKMGVPPLRTQ